MSMLPYVSVVACWSTAVRVASSRSVSWKPAQQKLPWSANDMAAPCVQAWLVPYAQVDTGAEQRPQMPRGHCGFFASWHRNSLHRRIIDHVRYLLDRRKTAKLAEMRVIITGAGFTPVQWPSAEWARCRAVSTIVLYVIVSEPRFRQVILLRLYCISWCVDRAQLGRGAGHASSA